MVLKSLRKGNENMILKPRYALNVMIDAPRRWKYVPYFIYVDFGQLFSDRQIAGQLDRNSIQLTTRTGEFVHFNLSDDFLYAQAGRINFLIEDTAVTEYRLLYDSDERGSFPAPAYIGLVGNGDCLRTNQGRPLPLFNGMFAEGHLVDIDGDGQNELIVPQIYSGVKDREWHVINAYRNTGSLDMPVWNDPVPLRCRKDNQITLIRGASSIQFCDLDGNGRPYLITCGYGAYNPGRQELYVHKNTGETDASGFPLFAYHGAISIPGATGYIGAFEYIDFFNDGRKGLLFSRSITRQVERGDPLWFSASEEEKAAAIWPRWIILGQLAYCELDHIGDDGLPVFREPLLLADEEGQPICSYSHIGFATWPNAATKKPDVLFGFHSGDFSEYGRHSCTRLVYLRQTGRTTHEGNLIMKEIRQYPDITDKASITIIRQEQPPYRGLLRSGGQLGGRILHYPLAGKDEDGCPLFGQPTALLQRNPHANSFTGFAHAAVCDFDGDGDVDIATGCETAHALLIENIGTRRRPVFTDAKAFCKDGRKIELLNGPFDDPGSFSEATLGQTSVFYLDFNFDGIPDLVVKVGLRLYLFVNTGTAADPLFADSVELFTEFGNRFGAHRNHPAIGDFTGSGCPDILCDARDMKALMLFRGFRDESGKLCFHEGEALKYEDGSLIIPREWHRYTKNWSFGDFAGNGKNDLLFNTCTHVLWLENTGSNIQPVFKRPQPISDGDGRELNLGHHICIPIPVDWDETGKNDLLFSGESGLFYLFRKNYLNGIFKQITYTLA